MASQNAYQYFAAPNPIQPDVGEAPAARVSRNLNAPGSNYASTYSYSTSNLIKEAIAYQIFDAAPAQYDPLKLLYMSPMEEVASDEFVYKEKLFGRNSMQVGTGGVGGGGNTDTITLKADYDAATELPIVDGDIISAPDGTPMIVTDITYGDGANTTTIDVQAQTAVNIPAMSENDYLSIQSATTAAGMNFFMHYDRVKTLDRYNYIQFFQRARRWDRLSLTKMQNLAQTNFLSFDKKECIEQLRIDLLASLFQGTRGEVTVAPSEMASGNYKAKMMGGYYPTMVDAGASNAAPSLSGLKAAFEALAFETNHKAVGGTRLIYGTPKLLQNLASLFKEPGLRYAPTDKIANLELKLYEFGGMKFVPVPVQLFQELSVFPAAWANRLLVVDQGTVNPVKLKGYDHIEMGQTIPKGTKGTREDYIDWWVMANMSLKYNNPAGGFYLNVVD